MRLLAQPLTLITILTSAVVPTVDAQQVQIDADVVYGHKFGMALTFDVYQPAESNGAGVVIVNSGGYVSPIVAFHAEEEGRYRLLDDSPRTQLSAQLLVENGFTVFNLRHGSSPKFVLPEVVADVRLAIRFIREVAQGYGVDPERLGLWGGSAGGHLSLLLGVASEVGPESATEQARAPVAAIVAYFPPSSVEGITPEAATRFPALDFPAEQRRELSPVHYATADDPPTLIIHGDQDQLVDLAQGEAMHEALLAAGVTTELVVIEGAGHGFRGNDAHFAMAQSLSWFQRYLR